MHKKKGIQATTGTVHYAVRVRHAYSDHMVLRPACRSGRGPRSLGANHYLFEVPDDREVTCKRCLAVNQA